MIFDEVRVVSRLMWNSRSQRVVGLAMSHEDMACLHDVYQTLDEDATTKNTTYGVCKLCVCVCVCVCVCTCACACAYECVEWEYVCTCALIPGLSKNAPV